MLLNQKIVTNILSPYTLEPFEIVEDGTSQTALSNNGRLGFFVEAAFGVTPNSSRLPDLGEWELKTVQLSGAAPKPITIGVVPEHEYRKIKYGSDKPHFSSSDPYKKMKNTLYIFYKNIGKTDSPVYIIDRWRMFSLDTMSIRHRSILQSDYQTCVWAMKNKTYADLSKSKNNLPKTRYLGLTYKGDKKYTYPAWRFSTEFITDVYHGA
jgi:hypothetical protein